MNSESGEDAAGAWTRRRFLQSSAAAAVLAGAGGQLMADQDAKQADGQSKEPRRPLMVGSANAFKPMQRVFGKLTQGSKPATPLEVVVAAVNIVEDDPNDHSVGLGGIPNEEGVVELDASCMDGRTHKAGAVAALRNIRNPSSVAKLVMERTDHVLLVGDGALRFARSHGFKEEDLLTEEARRIWLKWKEEHSEDDDWLPPGPLGGELHSRAGRVVPFTWGTINCLALDNLGDIAGVTSTSGLSYKIPGRVGDSPIVGAGLYVDNQVGAAGATGRGEACLQNCSSFFIVELMRGGMDPQKACLEAIKRVVDRTEPRLRDKNGRPGFGLTFYALAKDGRYGSASIWSGAQFAVHDAAQARLEQSAYLYEAPPPTTKPAPKQS